MEDCIFCKIVKGEIPHFKLWENDELLVFLDAFPAQEGHTLVVPKKHYENIFDLPDETAAEVLKVGKMIAKRIKEKLNCSGLNFLQSNGEFAGQVVMHYHIHLIPRYEGRGQKGADHIFHSDNYEYKAGDKEKKKIYEKLKF